MFNVLNLFIFLFFKIAKQKTPSVRLQYYNYRKHTHIYMHIQTHRILRSEEFEFELKDKEGGKRKCETTCRVGAKVLMRSCRSESIQLCGGGG